MLCCCLEGYLSPAKAAHICTQLGRGSEWGIPPTPSSGQIFWALSKPHTFTGCLDWGQNGGFSFLASCCCPEGSDIFNALQSSQRKHSRVKRSSGLQWAFPDLLMPYKALKSHLMDFSQNSHSEALRGPAQPWVGLRRASGCNEYSSGHLEKL